MSKQQPDWPSEQHNPIVEVFYFAEGEEPFISGVIGNVGMLNEIEEQLIEDVDEGCFKHGPGSYLFRTHYNPLQTGEFGRIEVPEWWDLEEIGFKPLPDGSDADTKTTGQDND